MGDRLHDHDHGGPRGGRAGRADPAAGPRHRRTGSDDRRLASRVGAQHRRAEGTGHDDRTRRDHRHQPRTRAHQAGRLTVEELALTSTQRDLWWGAIIGGFVIVLAVAALLTILVLLVRTIARRVAAVRDTLKAAAANTADTALIAETGKRVDAVLAEGRKHHLFLGRVLGKVRI